MASVSELLNLVPEQYSEQAIKEWIKTVLSQVPVEQVPIDIPAEPREKKVQLPALEAEIFRELIRLFGKPGVLPKSEEQLVGNPNITLLFLWALGEKYRLGLRYSTEVTPTGVYKYIT